MVFIKNRGEVIGVTDQVDLTIQFRDSSGNPINTDSYPQISIVQPTGLVALAPTSAGVSQIGMGLYSYTFTAPYNGPLGVWNDVWVGYANGFRVQQQFEFIVNYTQLPGVNTDGYEKLGNDPGFHYSQCAIHNINKLLKSLRARLKSSGKAKSTDGYGNTIYVSCDIYSTDMLVTFLATALWEFNEIPYFTHFTFDEDNFVEQFGEVIVEGASMWALASQALIERGREIVISDNGVNFTPPTMSEILQTQYSALISSHFEKLKYIKNSIRPNPLGLGLFSMMSSGMNPAYRMLRHLRQRRII